MDGIANFAKRGVCLAVVAALLFVTGVVAQLKPVADMAQGEELMAFDGLGVADPYGWFVKDGGGWGVVGMAKEADELRYTIAHGLNGTMYYATRFDWDTEMNAPLGNDKSFSQALAYVMNHANKRACSIHLGDPGRPTLNLDTSVFIVDGAKWGEVRLSGKFMSAFKNNSAQTQAALVLLNGASVVSSMDISTTKAFGVQVNDSSKFTFNGEDSVSCGNIINMGTNGSKVTVTGGLVTYMDNEGEGRLEVVGGTVGDKTRENYAIKNGERALAVISGDAEIVSADPGSLSGTILNSGKVKISGGRVSNENSGIYSCAINNGYSEIGKFPAVTITGGEITSKNQDSNRHTGAVTNNRGEITISGGHIHNDSPSGGEVISNNDILVISDSAKIESKSFNVVDMIYHATTDSTKRTLDITGGKIIANKGHAITISGGGRAYISGMAEIGNNNPERAAIYVSAKSSCLYLHGGTVTASAADAVAITLYGGVRGDAPGRLEMGGSPIVTGVIQSLGTLWNGDSYPINICMDNGCKFKPNGETYRILPSEYKEYEEYIVLKNGAGFVHNFATETTTDPDVEFAVKGNDVYATTSRPHKVKFDLNGSNGGDVPKTIPVIPGGMIGELAKPQTDGYLVFERIRDSTYQIENDGKWRICPPGADCSVNADRLDVFDFGVKKGTPVNSDLTLVLSWTGKRTPISVQESSRDLPVSRPSETAAIAPVVAASGSLTAGPTPVSRSAGAVNFFRSGVSLKKGKLFIYDASGNIVTTVSVSDPSGGVGRRPVASWNLQDAKGRNVAEGTYVARGVVTAKTGKTERVSVLVNVQR